MITDTVTKDTVAVEIGGNTGLVSDDVTPWGHCEYLTRGPPSHSPLSFRKTTSPSPPLSLPPLGNI